MGDVVVLEDVWTDALDELRDSHPVTYVPEAWSDPRRLAETVARASAIVVRNRTGITPELLDRAPNLRIVARAGTGLDNVDVRAADRAGVVVSAALGVNAVSVAEHTLLLALAVLRDLPGHDRRTRAGAWDRRAGGELSGRTWGVLGLGATGRATARVLSGFEVPVLGHDPYALDEVPGVEMTDLDELLTRADVLSVHLPATPETERMLDAEFFGRAKPGAIVVNVGRGEVVDEHALAAALTSGQLAGAGLDVRASEPPPPGPLDDVDNLVLTPHVAGITRESQQRIVAALVRDIRAVLAGKQARYSVGAVR